MTHAPSETSAAPPSGTQAVDRAAALLTIVVEADAPVCFAELIDKAGLARSTTSRLLSSMERNRLITRTETGEYIGGPLFVLYAARHDRTQELTRLAQPVLDALAEDTREAVHLAVSNGGRVENIAQVDGSYLLGARDWTGVVVPAHASALGKVLLAWDVIELDGAPLEPFTDETLRTREALDDDLETSRRRGYAHTYDELEVGLGSVAVPVFGPTDNVVATLGISGPTARLRDRAEELGRLLIDQAEELTRLLRHGPDTEGAA